MNMKHVLLVAMSVGVALSGSAGSPSEDQGKPGAGRVIPQVFHPVRVGVSPAVRSLKAELKSPDPTREREGLNPEGPYLDQKTLERQSSPDGALMGPDVPNVMPAPIMNFLGLSQATQGGVSGFFVSPPDTVGDVGPNHYVQCVNLACQVFNKTTGVGGPVFTISSLFASLGGECLNTNDGDPIVLYDPLADRWQLSQFSVANRPPSHECVAVSQTNDPTGAWWLYDFVIPNNYFNDYPKLGVWPDGYYMTAPLFEGPVFGQGAFIMNRQKMLVGDPTAELVFFDLTLAYPGLSRILPADVDGPAPPAGTCNYMAGIAADEFGDPDDAIRMFEACFNAADPQASTFTELPSVTTADYDPTFTEVSGNCGFAFTNRDDVEQPPPANCGQRIDTLGGRPMHRLAYRNSGTHESLVFAHTVDVNATPPTATSGHRAGARYTELRRSLPGGGWANNEEATFSPDAVHRFMPSAAMDRQGNIAVGYTASDLTIFPAVRWAGRLASDPPGGLFQGEGIVAVGGRSQTSTGSRWGDYSAMSVDPADDCTFWFTQEYYDPVAPTPCSATTCWTTRISSFKFPSCTSVSTNGTLSGTVTELGTGTPLQNAVVQANGYSGITNVSGNYSISLPAATYTATGSHATHASVSVGGLVVSTGGTTSQNFALPSGSLAGQVTSSVGATPIPGAKVAVSNGVTKYTNATGNYAAFLPAATYSIAVSADGFYDKTVAGLVVGTGVTTANVALDPAPELIVSGTAINDAGGNNNQAINHAECFALQVTLSNTSTGAPATGITATLSADEPNSGLTFTQAVSAYPDLAPGGGTGANVTAFQLISNPDPASAGQPLKLKLTVTTSTGTVVVPFTVATGGGLTSSNFAATGPVAIPDNNGTGATLPIPVSGITGTISKVKVRVRITHTFDGDLILRLRGPDGTIGLLTYQVGDAGAGFGTDCPADGNDTTFDDAAAISILDGAAVPPYVGSFRPQQPLSVFGGKSGAAVNGTWNFDAIDLGPADIGNIECVTVEINNEVFGGGGCFTKGDMNHPNRQTDLIFNSVPNGARNAVWFMDGVTTTASGGTPVPITPDASSAALRIVGADDFSNDNNTDLVFYNTTTGAVEFWLMTGINRPSAPVPLTGAAPLPLNWLLAATGDLNHDGRVDILWRNTTSQKLVIWKLGEGGAPRTQKTGNIVPTPDQAVHANWAVVALLDIDLDGNRDFLWYNSTSGNIVYWLMDENMVRTTGQFTSPTNAGNNNWKVAASGDFGTTCTNPSRDNQFDIVWRNETSGNIVVWTMDSSGNRTSGCFTKPFVAPNLSEPDAPLDWVVVGPR